MPKLDAGSGQSQANAVFEALKQARISDRVYALCFDTTASNTGRTKGAVAILAQKLDRILIEFYCGHHELELIPASVCKKLFGPTTAPQDEANVDFQFFFPILKDDAIKALENDDLAKVPSGQLSDVINTLKEILKCRDLKGDYRELTELSLMLLNESNDFTIKAPGSFSHARWMGRLLYLGKRILFRDSLIQGDEEQKNLRRGALFFSVVYCRRWLLCSNLFDAPSNLLDLYQDVCKWREIDYEIYKTARNKLDSHLTYLTPERIWMAFFSNKISQQTKMEMQQKLKG